MYLTDMKIEELQASEKNAIEAASKVFKEKTYPYEVERISTFMEENIVPNLVENFETACKKAKSTGKFVTPLVHAKAVQNDDYTWNITFSLTDDKKVTSYVVEPPIDSAFDSKNVNQLINESCEGIRLKAHNENETERLLTFNIYINLEDPK